MNGYHGKALHINLTTGESHEERLSEDVLRAFIGGIGLGTYLLHRECPPGVDPLGPENPLIFATSPFVGTAITTSAKYAIVTRSPLTGFIGDSLSGSHLAIELKRTGYDALVIRGACADWSVLHIQDGEVRIVSADHLRGLDTRESEAAVRADIPGARVAVIGPAGEHLVLYATISNDGRHAGRTGTGAVMGAKRLKAIAVEGSHPVRVADRVGLKAANSRLIERSRGPMTAKYRLLGTPANLLTFDRLGILPSYNFGQSTFTGAEQLSGEELHESRLAKVTACASCTVGCEHLYKALDETDGDATRLEYETMFSLGPMLGIGDPDAVIRFARQCDRLGIDSISAGGTIAWAMESVERGLLDVDSALSPIHAREEGEHGGLRPTRGLLPRFGDIESVTAVLDAIAVREGIGDLLAEGSRRAAARLGGGSGDWAMHVKGLELPGYEPRGLKTTALGFAVSPRGACHNRVAAYEADLTGEVDRFQAEVGRGSIAAEAEDLGCVLDSLVLCKFVRKCFDDLYEEAAELYRLVTGWDMSGAELRRAGERISNAKKLFNVREGWSRDDDTLPARCLDEPLSDGPGAGERLTRCDLDLMIGGYYAARGWTPEGAVLLEKTRELELEGLLDPRPCDNVRG